MSVANVLKDKETKAILGEFDNAVKNFHNDIQDTEVANKFSTLVTQVYNFVVNAVVPDQAVMDDFLATQQPGALKNILDGTTPSILPDKSKEGLIAPDKIAPRQLGSKI